MDIRTILLCYSDTGHGHRSAAKAIQTALEEISSRNPEAFQLRILKEEVVEHSHIVNRLLVYVYNFIMRYRQNWMKYYFDFIEWSKPNESQLGYWLSGAHTRNLLLRTRPSVVVSLHPMSNHFLARAIKDIKLERSMKLVVVVTDPNGHFWSGWACDDASLTIAPNDLAYKKLLSLGLAPARVKTIGMPVEPEFSRPAATDKASFLKGHGLNPDLLTVCLTGGSTGGGNLNRIYKALAGVRRPMQAIVLCGHNQHLSKEIESLTRDTCIPTVVIPYEESLSDLMNAVDLLVTKPGGLTVFEALARRLPMAIDLVTDAMPQEAGTAQLLFNNDLAFAIRQPDDIVPIVETLVPAARDTKPLPNIHSLNRVDAVFEIAETIVSELKSVRPIISFR